VDPFEGDSLFDGLDFATLTADPVGVVRLGADSSDAGKADAYIRLRRWLLTLDRCALERVELEKESP
jgi:hypothetical protein